jgi:uncharacterized protein
MKVDLEKTFPMPVSVDKAWTFLQNIEGVASCMPGARITERIDDSHYRGTIAVRMGPANLSFKGEVEVLQLDLAARTLRLIGKGADTSGTSAASMDLTARIEPGSDAQGSVLVGRSEVSMNGKAAAFGSRMMSTVADQLLKQFAANFAVEASKLPNSSSAPADADASALPADAYATAEALTSANAASSTASAAQLPAARELNAFALLWAVVRDWVRGVLKRTPV